MLDWTPLHSLVIGLTHSTTRAHLCRAVLEAVCFQSREVCMTRRYTYHVAHVAVVENSHILLMYTPMYTNNHVQRALQSNYYRKKESKQNAHKHVHSHETPYDSHVTSQTSTYDCVYTYVHCTVRIPSVVFLYQKPYVFL